MPRLLFAAVFACVALGGAQVSAARALRTHDDFRAASIDTVCRPMPNDDNASSGIAALAEETWEDALEQHRVGTARPATLLAPTRPHHRRNLLLTVDREPRAHRRSRTKSRGPPALRG